MIKKPGQEVITPEEYKNLAKKKKGENKFKAVRMETGGETYDSTKEGLYAQQLNLQKLLPPGHPDRVIKFETQIRYDFYINDVLICWYRLDFKVYYENRIECVDVKGYKEGTAYRTFCIKKNLMLAIYGIEIIEK